MQSHHFDSGNHDVLYHVWMGHVPWQTVTLPQGNFKWIKTVYIKSYYITCVLHEAYVLRCSGPLKTSGWIIRRDVLRWKLRANCQGRKERRTVWPSEGRAENFGLSIENIQHLMVNHHFPFEMAMIGGYTPCSIKQTHFILFQPFGVPVPEMTHPLGPLVKPNNPSRMGLSFSQSNGNWW